MGRIAREPLLHFIAAGLALFWSYGLFTGGSNGDAGDDVIIVDRAALLTFVQFRTQAFDPARAEQALDAMAQETRDALIEEYVREEALYRDALAMGLDEGDAVIRRRLVQKADFLAQGFIELGLVIDEDMLRAYFDENRDVYREPALITFTHVFFDAERRGEAGAREAAEALTAELNANAVPFSAAVEYGERFPFNLNYVERSSEEVVAHFGADMALELFRLVPSERAWYGPFQSPYGWHAVMVTRVVPARDPELGEVRERVVADLRENEIRRRMEEAIDRIVADYDVRVDLPDEAEEEH